MNDNSCEIIIVSYNTCDLVLGCIKSIFDSIDNYNICGITVIDNGSQDDTVMSVKNKYNMVKIIENKYNVGYSTAINIAVMDSQAKYFIVSNSDVIFMESSVQNLFEYLKQNKNVGAVGPQQFFPDGRWQRSFGHYPSIKEAICDLSCYTSVKNYFLSLIDKYAKYSKNDIMVEYIDGAVIGFSRRAYDTIGGFDEKFFFFGEEADFCLRLFKSGWKIISLQNVKVFHIRGASQGKKYSINEKSIKLLVSAKMQFLRKHNPHWKASVYAFIQQCHSIKMAIIYSVLGLLCLGEKRKILFKKRDIFTIRAKLFKEQYFVKKQQNESFFIWFDPVNNDPHFISLMSNILSSSNIKFDALLTIRSKFCDIDSGNIIKFMPICISSKLRNNIIIFKFLIALIYIPCLLRAILIIVKSNMKVVVSDALWFPLFDALALCIIRKCGVVPIVLVHRPYKKFNKKSYGEKIFFSKYNNYITLSNFVANYLNEKYSIPYSRIEIIQHPSFNVIYDNVKIDFDIYNKIMNWKKDRTLFISLSSLTEEHGLLIFAKIIQKCIENGEKYCFLICGDVKNEKQKRYLENLRKSIGWSESVRFETGFYSESQAKSWLIASDALILPYINIAQSGVKSLSLGLGTPVLVNNVGGLHELIEPGYNGYIIENNSIAEWLCALKMISSGCCRNRDEISFDSNKKFGNDVTITRFMHVLDSAPEDVNN